MTAIYALLTRAEELSAKARTDGAHGCAYRDIAEELTDTAQGLAREVRRLQQWGLDMQRNANAAAVKMQQMAESESNKSLRERLASAEREIEDLRVSQVAGVRSATALRMQAEAEIADLRARLERAGSVVEAARALRQGLLALRSSSYWTATMLDRVGAAMCVLGDALAAHEGKAGT